MECNWRASEAWSVAVAIGNTELIETSAEQMEENPTPQITQFPNFQIFTSPITSRGPDPAKCWRNQTKTSMWCRVTTVATATTPESTETWRGTGAMTPGLSPHWWCRRRYVALRGDEMEKLIWPNRKSHAQFVLRI